MRSAQLLWVKEEKRADKARAPLRNGPDLTGKACLYENVCPGSSTSGAFERKVLAQALMRTGKELLSATKPFAVDTPSRSWWYILSTGFLLVLTLLGTSVSFPWPIRIACSVGSGLLLLRLFVIYHDQQHHAILPHSRIAKGLMRVLGMLLLSPNSIWTSSHNHHHNHNSRLKGSNIGSFPVMTTAQFEAASRGDRIRYLFMRHPATILFGYIFIFLYGMCLAPFLTSPVKHIDSLIALLCHLGIAGVILMTGGVSVLLVTMIVPSFIACCLGSYLFYAQHNFPGVSLQSKEEWKYERAALESSSYMVMGKFMAWVTGNIGYHHIHHLNAKIPFYRLPEAMAALPELQKPRTTSLHPRDVRECLRLKLWDASAQAMIPLPHSGTGPS